MYTDFDKRLFFDLASGEERALKELFEKYSYTLYVFCNRFLHSEQDAEEIVNDTFLQLWKNRKGLSELCRPRDYMYVVCKNLTIDRIRKMAKQQDGLQRLLSGMEMHTDDADSQLILRESQERVEAVLKKISEKKALIYRLSREEGLSHAQIAECMGISKSRVKNVVVEILQGIRSELRRDDIFRTFFLLISTSFLFL